MGLCYNKKREEASATFIFEKKLDTQTHFDIFRNMETEEILPPLAPIQTDPQHTEAFKALGHLTRLNIFFYLVQKGDSGDSVGNIQAAINVPGPTLSHHLDILQRAGLLTSRREERFIFYSVRRETVNDMIRLLTDCC